MIHKSMPDFHSQDSVENVSLRGLEVQDHLVRQEAHHQADQAELQVPLVEAQEAPQTVDIGEQQL